jgi:hypothetical protein
MRISVLHSTCRVIQAIEAHYIWMSLAKNPSNIEYIFGFDDTKEANEVIYKHHTWMKWIVERYKIGAVNKCNLIAKKCSGEIMIQASEDVVPPQDWDIGLIQAADWSKEVVLDINEGVIDNFPHDCHHVKGMIMSRARYLKYGYWFHPDFHHLYADDWYSFCAERDKVIVPAKHLIFEHFHYGYGKRERDKHDIACKSPKEVKHGKETYERLKREYFETGKLF